MVPFTIVVLPVLPPTFPAGVIELILRFPAGVIAPIVIEPLAETVSAPPVEATAFELLTPSGTLSLKSGRLNVDEPSPAP